jgi:hypothetical protein
METTAEAVARTRDRVRALRALPYEQYLQTAWWRQRRREALVWAGGKCQLCSAMEGLDVHHNTYVRLGCEVETDLIVLCRSCHERHHGEGE